MKKIILIFIGIFILFSIILIINKDKIFRLKTDLLNSCIDKKYAYQRLNCLKPYFTELTFKKGAVEAVNKAKELQKKEVIDDCHLASHYIGEASFEKNNGQVGKAFASCPDGCIEGCFHGVMEAYVSGLNEEEIASKLPNVCSGISKDPKLTRQCIHGVGHGLLRHDQSLLASSLEVCNKFGLSSEICKGGVYMQNMNNYLLTDEKTLIEKLPNVCKPVIDIGIEKEIYDCHIAVGEGLMFYTGHDLIKSRKLCSYLGLEYREVCIKAAIEELSVNNKNL